MTDGYIKLYRQSLENPIVCKDSDYFAIWCYLLLNATHKEYDVIFKGAKIQLQKGQLLTGRNTIKEKFNISESKVQRVLKTFENEHQIEQQTSNKKRLITVLNWDLYQSNEQQSEQQLNNKRTTTEQQLNTNKNIKNDKNIKNIKKEIDKEKFGEFQNVFFTNEEYEKLKAKFSDLDDRIFNLSSYLASHSKVKYDSHYAVILNWARKDTKTKEDKDVGNKWNLSGITQL